MTFDEFEKRVINEPDLQLSWIYWNIWIPETGKLWIFCFLHSLNRLFNV